MSVPGYPPIDYDEIYGEVPDATLRAILKVAGALRDGKATANWSKLELTADPFHYKLTVFVIWFMFNIDCCYLWLQ